MASRGDVSFYRDVLDKVVVDRDGHRVGAILDLAAGPRDGVAGTPAIQRLVIRPRRAAGCATAAAPKAPLILAWELVEALEPRHIRLRQARTELAPSSLEASQILLRRQVMDQQIVDSRGLKLQRVNDIAMGFCDGALWLCGMDTGISGFLTRLGHRWGVFDLFRPLRRRLRQNVIRWDLVERLEPARGVIRLRLSRDELRSVNRCAPEPIA